MKPTVGKIKFEGYHIIHSEFKTSDQFVETNQSDHFEFNLEKSASVASDGQGFFLELKVDFRKIDSTLVAKAHARALFKTDNPIDESYLDEGMVKVNAPAILFPFVRAFINTMSVNSGYGQIILPAINFAKLENME